jgi:hypothetical protein
VEKVFAGGDHSFVVLGHSQPKRTQAAVDEVVGGDIEVQVNYTDTLLSHRFIRFEAVPPQTKIPVKGYVKQLKGLDDVEKVLKTYFSRIEREGSGIKMTKIQRDVDILTTCEDPAMLLSNGQSPLGG